MAIQDFTAGQVLTAAQMDALQANDYNQTVSTKTDNYTLVAADKGTRVEMNSATAKTITVDSGLFAAGDTLFIQNIGVGTCTITAGTCTVTTASSLALGTWAGGTLYFTSASAAIFFSAGGATYGTATGGTGVVDGPTGYKVTSFTSSGTLTVTKAGLFDVLAFGGGSGGGTYTGNSGSSGGGSGGILLDTIYLTADTAVVVGAGGAASTYQGLIRYGSASTIGSLPSGRVAAGSFSTCNASSGASEGFLGGLVGSILTTSTGATNVQGFAGGNATANTNGGGGGSTTAVGGNGSGTTGGNGAAGYDVSSFIGGSALFKGAGGGGSGSVTQGTGGSSVGGNASATNGVAAAANTASGGGAGNTASGAGGSGIIYFRWKV